MKLLNDLAQILIPMASLAPFMAISFYFGQLEKRVRHLEKLVRENENP